MSIARLAASAGWQGAAAGLRLHTVRAHRGAFEIGPIDLTLAAASYGCLLGPPGAGKSLLLRAICGLEQCRGRIEIGGRLVNEVPLRGRQVALLGQGGGLMPAGSVAGALAFAQAARGIPSRERLARRTALLGAFGLDGCASPARLSASDTLKARLAVALAGAPRLLLLDDPLEQCTDRVEACATLRALPRQHAVTVLHATSRREEALALADHLVLLDAGQALQSGTVATLYEQPASLYVARRLGAATILSGEIVCVENDVATITLACGPTIKANPPPGANDAARGSACQVLLRPERIAVSPLSAAELGEGAIAAVLREVTHVGETIRLRLAIGTDTFIDVSRPAGLGMRGLVEGRTMSVAWQSSHALTFLEPPVRLDRRVAVA